MAEAFLEERHLLKTLRWWDGFVIALCNPGFLIAALGFSIGALGTWGAVLLWGVSAAVGMLQTWIYAETASMFPDKPGGISLYAHEGWRGRFSLAGPIGAFGYWIGWSVVLSIFGKTIGDLIEAKWFPTVTWSLPDGTVHLGLSHFIAIGCIIAVWLLNIFGIRPAVWVSYLAGAGLMVTLVILIIVPFVTGSWHSSNMTWALHGFVGFKTAMVWLFLMGWSIYASEICATFAPEYRDTKRETTLALRSAGMFTLMVALLLPLGAGGVSGTPPTTQLEGEFYVPALTKLVGRELAGVVIVLLIGSLFLSMISSTADGSRALYGIARDGMTVKQLFHLNRFHVPARAMTADLVVNVLLVLFISSNIAILYMSNIGYILAHFLALTGFLMLRKDRPGWPRPIKVGRIWLAIAAVLAVYNAVLIGFGITNPALTGYGTFTDMWIGVGVLVGSVLLFFYRRLVQDRTPLTFREEVPTMPSAEQMALLREEEAVAAKGPVAATAGRLRQNIPRRVL
jgi:amino acid transporter